MKTVTAILVAGLFFAGCASHFGQHPLGAWRAGPGVPARVSIACNGHVPDWFVHRLLGAAAHGFGDKALLVDGSGDLHFAITFEPLARDFTPMFFVVPMATAFFGCPQGGITGEYSVRVSETASGRIIAVWEGRETRVFGLYRLIPRVERDVYEAMLAVLTAKIVEAVVPSAAGRAEDFSRDP
ncbi:MAG TPA: hypothetical protein PLM00_03515 [Spirochaetota bacterium]|nr:hypothetical protein [Spirochaetota bacterium]HPN82430.1 hypothetical protein [Spirochaetota bacterium]